MSTISLWDTTADVPRFDPLRQDTDADVCIVGGGIAGVTTAWLLAKAGRRVVLLERATIGAGASGRTTAHLSNALDDRYARLEQLHGADVTRLAAESHTAAINRIEAIVAEEEIDCGFERLDGYLMLAGGDDPALLDRELAAAHRAGLVDVERLDRAPIAGFPTGPCLRFPRQAQLHPLRYLAALARAVVRLGGRIHGDTPVVDVEGDATRPRVHTRDGHTVSARSVVVATNEPINDRFITPTREASYRSYVIGARILRGGVSRGLYWDTLDPYHYARVWHIPGDEPPPTRAETLHDVLLVGGEDHRTGQDDDPALRFVRLEAWMRARFPTAGEVLYRWSGQITEPADHLAFIGPSPDGAPNVWIASGGSGNGMTHGTVAGMLLTDLLVGRHNSWGRIYDPRRVTLGAAPTVARDALDVAAHYAEWLLPGSAPSAADIPRDAGAVVRRGRHLVAVYRDESGTLHERSAVCAHLGCIVAWNPVERSWDCPCHGSRYDRYGRVIAGPAARDLGEAGGTEGTA